MVEITDIPPTTILMLNKCIHIETIVRYPSKSSIELPSGNPSCTLTFELF